MDDHTDFVQEEPQDLRCSSKMLAEPDEVRKTSWLVTCECPLRTDSASWKSLGSFVQLIPFCNSRIKPKFQARRSQFCLSLNFLTLLVNYVTANNGFLRSIMTHWRRRQTGRQAFSFRVFDSSSVRVEQRLTDNGVVVVQVFGEPLLGYGLLIELDTSLCEEAVAGLITCGRELVVLVTRLLNGNAHGCCLHTSKKVKRRKKVLETQDDEEKGNEIDGKIEERITQRAHETWLWP